MPGTRAFDQLRVDRLVTGRDQMDGVYSYLAYRDYLAHPVPTYSRMADVDRAVAWGRLCDGSEPSDGTGEAFFLQDGADAAIGAVVGLAFVDGGPATSVPEHWMIVRDGLIGLSRCITHPHLACKAGLTVRDVARGLAIVVDVMCRAADRDCAHTASYGVGDMSARMTPVYLDLLCGRLPAWLYVVDGLGRQAAHEAGRDWVALRDAYSSKRMMQFCERLVSEVDGIADIHAAGAAYGKLVVSAAVDYDRHQRACFHDACGYVELPHGFPDVEAFAACVHEDVWWRVEGCMAEPARSGSDMTCYDKLYQAGPVGIVSSLPVRMEETSRKGYIAERRRQGIACRMGRRDPDLFESQD